LIKRSSIALALFFVYNEGYFLLDHVHLVFAFPLPLVIIFIFVFVFVPLLGPTVLRLVTGLPAVVIFICGVLAAPARPMSGELAVVAVRGLLRLCAFDSGL
jgi:hypothetical protein